MDIKKKKKLSNTVQLKEKQEKSVKQIVMYEFMLNGWVPTLEQCKSF